MTNAYCHCMHCGTIFATPQLFGGGGFGSIYVQGNAVTCPKCGRFARMIDGEYKLEGARGSSFVPSNPLDAQIIQSLQRAYALAKQGRAVDDIISEIERASPEASHAARSAFMRGGIRLLILFIYLLVSGCDSFKVSATLDINKALDQLHVYATGAEPYPEMGDEPPAPKQTDDGDQTGSISDGWEQPSEPERTPKQTRQQRRHSERQANKHSSGIAQSARSKPKVGPKR